MRFKLLAVALISLATSIAPDASAQVTMLGDNGKAIDTMRNGVTEYLTSPSMAASGLAGKYDVQLVVRNDSATTSVTAILEGTNDGVNWDRVFKTPGQDGIACDSLVFTGSKIHTVHVEGGMNKIYGAWNGNYQSTAGRRSKLRWRLIHAAGGRSSYEGKLLTSQ